MLLDVPARSGSPWTTDNNAREGFETLRKKWQEVPYTRLDRIRSRDLLKLDDESLKKAWEAALADKSTGANYDVRGWFYTLYAEQMRGKRVLDIGSGLGFDTITFARAGAKMTCVDLARDNLNVICRLADIYGVKDVQTHYLEDLDSLRHLEKNYDVIWACGSLINSPFDFTHAECQLLVERLKIGGRWIELAYPKTRWVREGCMPFESWGEKTDGGAPWMEWKDIDKVQRLLYPARFNVVLDFEYHNSDFVWFDLLRVA